MQVELPHLAERPAAGDRVALTSLDVAAVTGLSGLLVGDVEAVTEEIANLVVLVGRDRFRQRDYVRVQLTEAVAKH